VGDLAEKGKRLIFICQQRLLVGGAPSVPAKRNEKGGWIMMKKVKMVTSVGIMLVLVFSVSFLTLTVEAEAKAKVVAIGGMTYNVNFSLEDNLKSLIGKKVYVTLDSGKTLAGSVKEVGKHLIHLEKLDGKDFFDALIRIENIGAIEARFREFER